MATSTGEVEKINVRSPYYLTVDSQGSPSSGEPTPPEYDPPATITQPLGCGEQINIGEDVGIRVYEVDVTNRSGSFTVNFTINIPVKITHQLTEDSSPTVVGYKGNNQYEQQLLDMGIPASELTGLSSGTAQGGIPITRSTDSASTLTITVEAPLATDDYQLIMSCPDETAAPVSTFSLPSSIPTNTNLLDGSQTLGIVFRGNYTHSFLSSVSLKVYISGSLVETISPASLDMGGGDNPTIIFSNISGLDWATGSFPDNPNFQTPLIIDNSSFISGDNKIELEFNWDTSLWNSNFLLDLTSFYRTGIFRNTTANAYQFAYPYYQNQFSFYGATDRFTTEVRQKAIDRFFYYSSGVRYSFIYNTTTGRVSNSTDTNRLDIFEQDNAF
jgi:hypothetical protein